MDYINFIDGSGCWSNVGYVGGKQDISLQSNGCIYRSKIKHEIYHSLGYYHEQSRPDRDNFVTINFGNIKINKEHNFKFKQNTETFGVPYDGRSNMHYGYNFFSKNGLPTIEAKVNTYNVSIILVICNFCLVILSLIFVEVIYTNFQLITDDNKLPDANALYNLHTYLILFLFFPVGIKQAIKFKTAYQIIEKHSNFVFSHHWELHQVSLDLPITQHSWT